MKKLMIIISLFMLASCKGPMGKQGERGDNGNTGLPGPGAFVFLNGNVISDDFVITDSRINQADQISVYLGDGTNAAQLPYYLPAKGINTFYVFRRSQVEIVNAQTAGATKYTVEIITQ